MGVRKNRFSLKVIVIRVNNRPDLLQSCNLVAETLGRQA